MTPYHVQTDDGYDELERIIASRVGNADGPFFTTSASGLFDVDGTKYTLDRME